MATKKFRRQGKAITERLFQANPKVKQSEVMAELEANNLYISKTTVYGWLRKLKKAGESPTLPSPVFPFEQIMEAILKAFEEAKKVPGLEKTVNQQKNIIAARENQIKGLEKDLQETMDIHRRYKVAVQQGEVPLPKNKERA